MSDASQQPPRSAAKTANRCLDGSLGNGCRQLLHVRVPPHAVRVEQVVMVYLWQTSTAQLSVVGCPMLVYTPSITLSTWPRGQPSSTCHRTQHQVCTRKNERTAARDYQGICSFLSPSCPVQKHATYCTATSRQEYLVCKCTAPAMRLSILALAAKLHRLHVPRLSIQEHLSPQGDAAAASTSAQVCPTQRHCRQQRHCTQPSP